MHDTGLKIETFVGHSVTKLSQCDLKHSSQPMTARYFKTFDQ